MPSTIRLSLIAAAAASALFAGCASNKADGGAAASAGSTAGAAASAPAAAPAAPAPAPVAPPKLPGLDYATIREAASDGSAASIRKALVGETVSVELARANGRGVPAGAYAVDAEDGIFFRCATSERGFRGGTVTAKVRSVQVTARPKHRVLELDRCAEVAAATPAPAPAPARAAAPAPAPATAAAASVAAASSAKGSGTRGAGKPGMDANGNVVDSSKVEAGSGITVKGINDYEGEITGNPAANSKFTRLQIGMPVRQVTDLIGPPTDQGGYMTGKAWIPFYFGGDRHRFEMTYKGQGRLIFAGGGMGDFSSGYLIWIIHNPNEPGYR
ncbi:hypothetical protein [uncultured Pseudacidovorax sp.]|uniref:hypothetical protein n=1 Tax=uncultured Pseudacidovorax sp. TaxID=679313 RepID=UPI0025DB3EC2|nr:hypothetical protein [uncultured Pseudacidovorax sp.]